MGIAIQLNGKTEKIKNEEQRKQKAADNLLLRNVSPQSWSASQRTLRAIRVFASKLFTQRPVPETLLSNKVAPLPERLL